MAEKNNAKIDDRMEKIVSLSKRRGFIYQGSEIYGGLAGTWDYGPLGVSLKKNIENLWWKYFVDSRDDMYGLDSAILMNPKVWEASGHVGGFNDPLVECGNCHAKQRVDKIVDEEEYKTFLGVIKDPKFFDTVKNESKSTTDKMLENTGVSPDRLTYLNNELDFAVIKSIVESVEESEKYVGTGVQTFLNHYVSCPVCGKKQWLEPKQFNMMFKTSAGSVSGADTTVYLRPETAQGMFVNFKNILDTYHPKLPFGLAQIGRNFRNEIAPRDFIFRVRELEIMEFEYFIAEKTWEEKFAYWQGQMMGWFKLLGFGEDDIRQIEIADGERAHYSKRTIDFHFKYPQKFDEIGGLAYRTDFDLKNHIQHSGVDLQYLDPSTNEKFVPHVLEPTFGLGRHLLAVLVKAYTEDELGGESRVFLKFPPHLAPVKAAVFPLLKNKPELVEKAREIYVALKKQIPQIMWDDNGNIGKRYRRQDEIGTPWCITIDFDTLGENPDLLNTVTLRDRDTGEQSRISVAELAPMLLSKIQA